jgi:GT2 family glycosyltransferase
MVSVVIPCRNEVKAIRATVEALLKSNYPSLEVLVVDGMSEDGTRDVLHALTKVDPRVRLIDNPQKLTPYAFNYQHVYDTDSGRYVSLAMESKFGVGMGNYRTMHRDALVDTVGIPLYRQSIFKEVGLFDERLTRNQDDDFNFRVRQQGYKIMYVHQAKATYLVRASLSKTFRQYFQYGYFKVFVNRKHRAVTTVRQLIPAAFVAFLVCAAGLSIVFPPTLALLTLVLLIYVGMGLALAGAGLGLAVRCRVLVSCFILHMGYGLGYWQGIWDFLLIQRAPRETLQRQTT